jgi:hypothetical protein
MVEDIIKARETGIGVNGEFVLFYERQPKAEVKAGRMVGLAELGELRVALGA